MSLGTPSPHYFSDRGKQSVQVSAPLWHLQNPQNCQTLNCTNTNKHKHGHKEELIVCEVLFLDGYYRTVYNK
jgi:hypothetical protein